jgi:hypothetical protein
MRHWWSCARCSVAVLAWLALCGCQLRRPDTVPSRMIEPELSGEPAPQDSGTAAVQVRLLETQARAHIGRRLLHQRPDGELIEDAVWHWSTAPDRYLDTALRLELAGHGAVRIVDSPNAIVLAVTLLAWQLELKDDTATRLLGAIEVRITAGDHVVRTEVVRDSELVSGTLPGDLSVAAGRLLRRLSSAVSKRVAANGSSHPATRFRETDPTHLAR